MKRPHYDLIIAWANGAEIETYHKFLKEWVDCKHPKFFDEAEYRIKKTKPSINWDHVSPKFNWLAVDEDGDAYLFDVEPEIAHDLWDMRGRLLAAADCFSSYQRGNCDWKESLVQRPEGDDK